MVKALTGMQIKNLMCFVIKRHFFRGCLFIPEFEKMLVKLVFVKQSGSTPIFFADKLRDLSGAYDEHMYRYGHVRVFANLGRFVAPLALFVCRRAFGWRRRTGLGIDT